jgi:DNA-binding Xre family transcriptional regulator
MKIEASKADFQSSLAGSRDLARRFQDRFRRMSGQAKEPEDPWLRPGGMRLAGAQWRPGKKNIAVVFQSGHHYHLPVAALEGIREKEIFSAFIEELEDRVVVMTWDGRTTEFPSDFVLFHCEPRYRRKVEAAGKVKDESFSGRVGRRVRQIRKMRGMSLRRLAAETGMAVANASNLETGKHEPRLETLDRVAAVLGVTVAELVER